MGGGGGWLEDLTRGVTAAATAGTSEIAFEQTSVGRKAKKGLGFKGTGAGTLSVLTPGGAVSEGATQFKDFKSSLKEGQDAAKELSERQAKLFESQQAAIREDRAREDRTRRRAKAQARKRLALGFLAGKQGTVKTGALGLQNPANIARRTTGTV